MLVLKGLLIREMMKKLNNMIQILIKYKKEKLIRITRKIIYLLNILRIVRVIITIVKLNKLMQRIHNWFLIVLMVFC